jgi:outer membrane immunogenic protein
LGDLPVKRLVIAATIIVAGIANAMAADMPVKAPALAPMTVYSWTGFYVGGNVGYGWGQASNNWNYFAPNSTTGNANCAVQASCFIVGDTNHLNGVFGGGQVGYNWQFNRNWLAGIEADFQGSGQQGSQNLSVGFIANGLPATGFLSHTEKMPWFGTFRGRLGYTADRWVIYATGGLAYGRVDFNGTATATGFFSPFVPGSPPCPSSPCPLANFNAGATKIGWTVGAGVEAAIVGNWSVKAEYLYMDLGTVTASLATVPGCFGTPATCNNTAAGVLNYSSKVTDNIVRVGLNYRFGSNAVVARY